MVTRGVHELGTSSEHGMTLASGITSNARRRRIAGPVVQAAIESQGLVVHHSAGGKATDTYASANERKTCPDLKIFEDCASLLRSDDDDDVPRDVMAELNTKKTLNTLALKHWISPILKSETNKRYSSPHF